MTDDVQKLVKRTSYLTAAIAVALSPVPLADEVAFLPVFGVMTSRIGKARGLAAKQIPWRPIAGTALAALAARATINVSVSYVPGVAAVANAVSAVAVTRLLGSYIDDACADPAAARSLSVKDIAAKIKEALRARKAVI